MTFTWGGILVSPQFLRVSLCPLWFKIQSLLNRFFRYSLSLSPAYNAPGFHFHPNAVIGGKPL
jgi:hypothetical protein